MCQGMLLFLLLCRDCSAVNLELACTKCALNKKHDYDNTSSNIILLCPSCTSACSKISRRTPHTHIHRDDRTIYMCTALSRLQTPLPHCRYSSLFKEQNQYTCTTTYTPCKS